MISCPIFLYEPFIVTTLVGESVLAKRIYRECFIRLPNRVTHVEFVELYDRFDVILGMDRLHDSFPYIDCITTIVKLDIPNEPILSGRREILLLQVVPSLVLRIVK